MKQFHILVTLLALLASSLPAAALRMSRAEYEDRINAAWTAEIIGTLMGFQFEHKASSVERIDKIPPRFTEAPVDDDFYYEMVAIRGFEKYGINMTVEQLGEQWKENSAGSWGSSEQARLLLARGVKGGDSGHPRYNRLWFSIGPQFSADVYGMIAPGMPNLAGKLARNFGHLNGYAEGVDGAVFVAGMVSLAFVEKDPREIVKKAAHLLDPKSPYRQCLDMVIAMAEKGARPSEIFDAIEDRWHIEYPATNNAVPNGGIVAASVWFGEGDFLQTVNLAYGAADFTDADCNAANASTVVGVLKGMKGLPPDLVARLKDHIKGSEMGGVKLTPPVDESISSVALRTAAVGAKFINANGGKADDHTISAAVQDVVAQSPELFNVSELTKYWNPDWTLERAGVGGAGGGMRGIRGNTYLDGDVLATYPRDEVRGALLKRTVTLSSHPKLTFKVAADPDRSWRLEVMAGNKTMLGKLITGSPGTNMQWQTIEVPLDEFAGEQTVLRLFQRVLLVPAANTGNAYWRDLKLE
jgi:hypothetical protein